MYWWASRCNSGCTSGISLSSAPSSPPLQSPSSWVTACRVDGGVVIQDARRCKFYHGRGIFTALRLFKYLAQWWVSGGLSAIPHEPAQTTEAGKTKTESKPEKPMQTKQSVTNSNNHQPSTACREKHAAMKLPIRSTLIAAFGLLSVLLSVHLTADAQGIPPRSEAAHAPHLSPSRFDLVPASDAIANCESMPNPAATVAVFPREDVRGVDTLDLHAEGLRPNTTFAVFLTEMPVPPFGAVQYIGDFTTNAAGRGSVRVDAIIDEAFAFNNITGVRTDLNHIVFWFADPGDDEDCVPGSAPTHFDGDGEAGVAAMSSKNFLPGAPLP